MVKGELILEGVYGFVARNVEDPADVTVINGISAECKPATVGLQRCKVIAKFLDCYLQTMKERGYDPKKYDL